MPERAPSALAESLLSERSSLLQQHQPRLLELSALMSSADLNHELQTAEELSGENYGAFSIFVGIDNLGRDCLWIRNAEDGQPHLAIPIVGSLLKDAA